MDKQPLLEFIQNSIPDFKVTRENLGIIAEQFEAVEFAKHEYLLKEGTISGYFFLEEGFMRAFTLILPASFSAWARSYSICSPSHTSGLLPNAFESLIAISGDIEGRVIFDMEPPVAAKVASVLAGTEVSESDQIVRETVCELANMIIGSAVTSLNDEGFRFKIHPPEIHESEVGYKGSEDTEALVLCFDTPAGSVYINVAMRYNRRRRADSAAAS